ncbi:MAG: sodium:proton antiporter NhaD [Bacteroidetes bacterium]|nr:sodium:proton antiporter NhaD [Bacteroidota bacterium]
MEIFIIAIFILGYVAIAFEQSIKINKAASALLTGVLCWTAYILFSPNHVLISQELTHHLGNLSGILFFLMGAMTIVELIDAYDGFEIITSRIKTTDKRKLLWIIGLITFFLSAVLDNLTAAIVMVSLCRKLLADKNDRMIFSGMVVIAANSGGAWSPIGDVTTTMLWIGGQITSWNIIVKLFVPSLVCLLAPLLVLTCMMKGETSPPVPLPLKRRDGASRSIPSTPFERTLVFFLGIGVFLFVPVFKTLTHLPPYMGILFGLGILWIVTELIHHRKDEEDKDALSVVHALRKIDLPSILFFLGILVAVSALESTHILEQLAQIMDTKIGNTNIIVMCIGILSSIVDNVPLVAATMGMYDLNSFPTDSYLWEFIAYCTGTGGSILIIGSAAGVAVMGMEKINFFWYFKRIGWLAALGYFSGAAAYITQEYFHHL